MIIKKKKEKMITSINVEICTEAKWQVRGRRNNITTFVYKSFWSEVFGITPRFIH